MVEKDKRYLILTEGQLGAFTSKTANALLRFCPENVAAIIDSLHVGEDPFDLVGEGKGIPVVASVEEGLSYHPTDLVIGIAPVGGRLPDEWRDIIRTSLQNRLRVISGLHDFLGDDPEFRTISEKYGSEIIDLRKPPSHLDISQGLWRKWGKKTILTVGTDCNIGKMTALWIIHKQLLQKGIRSVFVGTGQTGILLSGRGVAVDAVISDFIAGSIEAEIDKVMDRADVVLVEGQGALTHMGYSGVTLGLIHGTMPDGMILCHQLGRLEDDYGSPIQNINEIINLHLKCVSYFKPTKFMGTNLITYGYDEQTAQEAILNFEKEYGMITEDLRRFPSLRITENIIKEFKL